MSKVLHFNGSVDVVVCMYIVHIRREYHALSYTLSYTNNMALRVEHARHAALCACDDLSDQVVSGGPTVVGIVFPIAVPRALPHAHTQTSNIDTRTNENAYEMNAMWE